MSENNPHVVKTKVMALPKGFRPARGQAVKISIAFDDSQYEALWRYAQLRGVSFAEAVRRHLTLPEQSPSHHSQEA